VLLIPSDEHELRWGWALLDVSSSKCGLPFARMHDVCFIIEAIAINERTTCRFLEKSRQS
jgi:hypothetical protein